MIERATSDEIRAQIDGTDEHPVPLLAERAGYDRQALRFKRSADEARAPARQEQVTVRVRRPAAAPGATPRPVAHVHRSTIGWSVAAELAALGPPPLDDPCAP